MISQLKNFSLIENNLAVEKLLLAAKGSPLWNEIKDRQLIKGSPHKYTRSIFVRWSKELTPHAAFNDLEAVDYPARTLIPEVNALIDEVLKHATDLGRVLLVEFFPGQEITPHVDEGAVAAHYDRFHIPLFSEEGNEFHCEDECVHMKAGELWWFNNKRVHWLKNKSNNSRIHLIVDAISKTRKEIN